MDDLKFVLRSITDIKDMSLSVETRTRDLEEKKKGLAAKDHLAGLLEDSNDVVLFIPADSEGDIKDVFTFNRVLGYIFIDSENVSSRMVADGHATAKKEKK